MPDRRPWRDSGPRRHRPPRLPRPPIRRPVRTLPQTVHASAAARILPRNAPRRFRRLDPGICPAWRAIITLAGLQNKRSREPSATRRAAGSFGREERCSCRLNRVRLPDAVRDRRRNRVQYHPRSQSINHGGGPPHRPPALLPFPPPDPGLHGAQARTVLCVHSSGSKVIIGSAPTVMGRLEPGNTVRISKARCRAGRNLGHAVRAGDGTAAIVPAAAPPLPENRRDQRSCPGRSSNGRKCCMRESASATGRQLMCPPKVLTPLAKRGSVRSASMPPCASRRA